MDKPPPKFAIGQQVRVILNDRNITPREGLVRELFWHFKHQQYYYYIEAHGRKVSKRYFEEDLEPC